MAEGLLPPVVAVLTANIMGFKAGMAEAKASMQGLQEGNVAAGLTKATSSMVALGAAAVGVGAISVKMAADFEQATNRLITSAGESKNSIDMVRNGILDMAGQVGFTAQELATAMYTVDSAGFHAADSLTILKAAAQGAKTEQADLKTTVDAVTTTLVDYHLKASDAATVMSKLVAAVGDGKTTLQELASSLHSVTPLAANLGISIDQVTAAVAAMTVHGMSADQATQNLADTIRHLANPTNTMVEEMGQLGLSSQKVSQMLSDPNQGLQGALQSISETILNKMGPSGMVLLDTLHKSTSAGADLNTMLGTMPPQLKTLAEGLENGSVTLDQWRKGIKGLPGDMDGLAVQFFNLYQKSNGFNAALKAGTPDAQTYTAALAKMMGDSTGLNTALMLTGENAATFAKNIKDVSGASADASGNVMHWSDVQDTLNQKLSDVEGSLSSLAIKLGNILLPMVKKAADGLTGFVSSLTSSKDGVANLEKGLEALATVGLVGVIAKVAASAGSLVGLGAAAGPVGLALALLATGAVHDFSVIKQTLDDSNGNFADFAKSWQKNVENVNGSTNLVLNPIGNVAGVISKFVMDSIGSFSNWSTSVGTDIINVSGMISSGVGSKIGQGVKGWSDGFQDNLRQANTWADGVIKAVGKTTGLDVAFGKIGDSLKDLGTKFGEMEATASHSLATMASDVAKSMGDSSISTAQNTKSMGDSVGKWITDTVSQVQQGQRISTGTVSSWFASMADNVFRGAIEMGNNLRSGFNNMQNIAGQGVQAIKNVVTNFFAGAGNWLFQAGRNIVQGVANGISAGIGAVGSAISAVTQFISDHLPKSPAKLGPLSGAGDPTLAGRTIVHMIAAGIGADQALVGGSLRAALGASYMPSAGPGGFRPAYAPTGQSGAVQQGQTVVQVFIDGRQVQNLIQKTTLRTERVNVNNGLSRTAGGR